MKAKAKIVKDSGKGGGDKPDGRGGGGGDKPDGRGGGGGDQRNGKGGKKAVKS